MLASSQNLSVTLRTGYLEYYPQLAGQTFGDLAFFFDDAIVFGLVNRRTGRAQITPPPGTLVRSNPHQSAYKF